MGRMDEKMDGWINGLNGWIDECVDVWMNEQNE